MQREPLGSQCGRLSLPTPFLFFIIIHPPLYTYIQAMDLSKIDRQENLERMRKGELYYAFTPDLVTARYKCNDACQKFNNAGDIPRRRRVELWKEYVAPFQENFKRSEYARVVLTTHIGLFRIPDIPQGWRRPPKQTKSSFPRSLGYCLPS